MSVYGEAEHESCDNPDCGCNVSRRVGPNVSGLAGLLSQATSKDTTFAEMYAARDRLGALAPEMAALLIDAMALIEEDACTGADSEPYCDPTCERCRPVAALLARFDQLNHKAEDRT